MVQPAGIVYPGTHLANHLYFNWIYMKTLNRVYACENIPLNSISFNAFRSNPGATLPILRASLITYNFHTTKYLGLYDN